MFNNKLIIVWSISLCQVKIRIQNQTYTYKARFLLRYADKGMSKTIFFCESFRMI